MRLDRDSKQPIWLGLLLIFAAFIFTLFFITRVHAADFSAYDYNNVLLVQFSGSTIEFCFADGSFGFRRNIGYEYTDGVPVITQDELENNLEGVFAYLLPSETIVLLFDNYAAAGPYLDTKSFFAQRGCAVLDYSGSFPLDVSGFSLSKINAGTWFIPFYTRSVPLTPSPSPSPTPTAAPSVTQSLLFYGNPRYGNSPFSSAGYYLFDFIMSSVPDTVDVDLQDNSSLAFAVSNYNVESPWVNNVILHYAVDSYSNINIYLKGICQSVKVYYLGSVLVSQDFDFLRQNYTSQDFVNNTSYSYWTTSKGITGMNLYFNNDSFSFVSSSFSFNNQSVSLSAGGLIQLFNYNSSSASSQLVQAYRYGLSNSEYTPGGSSPTVAPPTPTEAPHVIINWPSGTPTPTPPFSVPAEDPGGGGSGSPGGSSQGSLTPGQVNSTLNTFKQYTQNNGAFAFLYACTSLIPDVALYFLFILLFILLLLACLRLFVHFTGG